MPQETRFQKFIKTLNLLKKPVDILDDAWNGTRGILSPRIVELVGPFLVGSVSVFIHLLEGYNSITEFFEAYREEQIGQRKTRLLTNFLSFFMAGAGAGLSVTLLVGGLAEMGWLATEVASMALLPFLIPTLLFGIYSLSLWKHSYVLHRSKEIEEEAKKEYENYIKQPNFHHSEAERLFKAYQDAHEARLTAEKEVALHTIEVAGSALVCVGILLGTAAILGSIASFGALPLGLLIGGVALGFASKIYEYFDDKKELGPIDKLINYFRKVFDLPIQEPQFNPPNYSPKLRNYFRKTFDLSNDEPRDQHTLLEKLRNESNSNTPELTQFRPSMDEIEKRSDYFEEPKYRYHLWSQPREMYSAPIVEERPALRQ